jgi:hypothetical protein
MATSLSCLFFTTTTLHNATFSPSETCIRLSHQTSPSVLGQKVNGLPEQLRAWFVAKFYGFRKRTISQSKKQRHHE